MEKKLVCPKCGREGTFTAPDRINTALNPELNPIEIFQWTCPGCGEKVTVDYPFVYHQQQDKFMICLVPAGNEDIIPAIEESFTNEIPVCSHIAKSKEYRNRIVTSVATFQEKLCIFNAGLDDRVIELMKLFIGAELMEKNGRQIHNFRFVEGSRFIVDDMESIFDRDMYDAIAEKYQDCLAKDRSTVIDSRWALLNVSEHSV